MNYVILIGIALFFILTAVHDGATGWDFDGGPVNFRTSNGDYTLRVRSDGDIDIAADGSGVRSMSRRGSLDVLMTRNGTDRRVVFTGPEGTIERQYFVAGVMPIVLRETAINARERVLWLIDNRGHAGLLDEIELINSDFAQRVYSVEYAKAATIASADFERLMNLTADNMSSDFDVRTTLIETFDAQQPTGPGFVALLGAGETISSDFDARMVLEHVGPSMPRTPEAAGAYV